MSGILLTGRSTIRLLSTDESRWTSWSFGAIEELVGGNAAIGSLVFVALQIRSNSKTLTETAQGVEVPSELIFVGAEGEPQGREQES